MRSNVLRLARQQFVAGNRRHASMNAEQAQVAAKEQAAKAKDAAINAANKAVVLLGKSGESFAKLASKTGGRTGSLLKAVESAIPPTIYYSKVAIEIGKIVFRGQKMTPPDLATFQSTFRSLLDRQNITAYSRNAMNTLRNASPKDLAQMGVIGAEVLGFFTVGEMIGRRKIVGYRGKVAEHH